MKTNENQKSTNSQPATQKPFFVAKPEQPFFTAERAQSTPFFQPKAVSTSAIQAKSTTREAEVISQPAVQRMSAFESEEKDKGEVQRKEESNNSNQTGLPDNLKTGIENISGYSLDDVRVHYNSSKPSQLKALAYTQGTEIHVAPGQEKHLPHEAWHVVQQMQGRVKPTMQMKGVQMNDDEGLEREADALGELAKRKSTSPINPLTYMVGDAKGATMSHTTQMKVYQRLADDDLPAAQQNQSYHVRETEHLHEEGTKVYAAINRARTGKTKDAAAAGLRHYWQTLNDGFDGKKAEMYEAALYTDSEDIPILASNEAIDPDVRFVRNGKVYATEVKTINSDYTSSVNSHIIGADAQLAKRQANSRYIKIRIESEGNRWPDARELTKIKNNGELLRWLTAPGRIPLIPHTDKIQVEGINASYDGEQKRNFSALVKPNGEVKKTGAFVW
ncbi:DUF4157 domain-containing protein [Nostoc sp. MS1]|uniref:eCIS core domain-containing protein n=1 Tax=Nostoc sp. MS1 TaxID=2764711 RepID=UPI001CC4FD73|nr:DUF4157 domain-containing protein [Nostoc sp. MS1]BCL33739.1 hypothetical protein NSMS1_01860 [Nostoc sp. MS1]